MNDQVINGLDPAEVETKCAVAVERAVEGSAVAESGGGEVVTSGAVAEPTDGDASVNADGDRAGLVVASGKVRHGQSIAAEDRIEQRVRPDARICEVATLRTANDFVVANHDDVMKVVHGDVIAAG